MQTINCTLNLASDAEHSTDPRRILRIPFVNAVKLRALLLKTGPSEHTPSKVMLYPNTEIQTFDDIADTPAAQEFAVAQGREVGQYNLKSVPCF